jgi:hypothetical protein
MFLDSIPLNPSARRGSSPSDRFYEMNPKELASVPADEIAVLLWLTADGPTSLLESFNCTGTTNPQAV